MKSKLFQQAREIAREIRETRLVCDALDMFVNNGNPHIKSRKKLRAIESILAYLESYLEQAETELAAIRTSIRDEWLRRSPANA